MDIIDRTERLTLFLAQFNRRGRELHTLLFLVTMAANRLEFFINLSTATKLLFHTTICVPILPNNFQIF